MSTHGSQRDGFALAAAVMALVLVGALVTGGFYAASQEGQIASSVRYAGEAFNVAEHGLHKVVGTWNLARYQAILVGNSAVYVDTVRAGVSPGAPVVGEARVEVRRLSTFTYFLSSTGTLLERGRATGSTRSLGMLVRTTDLDFKTDRAVQVLGGLHVSGNSTVDGNDHIPPGWDQEGDCQDTGAHAGVVAKDIDLVTDGGSGEIIGEPEKLEDPTIADTSFTQFGDWSYDELAAKADKRLDPGSSFNDTAPATLANGECDTAQESNWGDPRDAQGACRFYFPIIHARGDLTLNGTAYGQGILLVDGDLTITGGYEFTGIVVVKGQMDTGQGNSKVNGVTMIMNSEGGESNLGDPITWTGTPVVSFSSCAIGRAVRYNTATARAFPIAERSWFDLTAAGMEVEEDNT